MSNKIPETTSNFIFPNNAFGGKFDPFMIKGKVRYATTDLSHVKVEERDDLEKFTVEVEISLEDFKALNTWRDEEGHKLSGVKKVMVKVKELDEETGEPKRDDKNKFTYVLDEEGNPVEEFSHYRLLLSQKAYKDGKLNPIKFKVKKGVEFEASDIIGTGSEVIIDAITWTWYNPKKGEGGVSHSIRSVSIIDLVPYQSAGKQGVDPLAAFGLDSSEYGELTADPFAEEATKVEAKVEANVTHTEPVQQVVPVEPAGDEWGEDIPF